GWRGAVAGVVPMAIEAFSHVPGRLIVAIGPHIRVSAFEIGEDVADAMDRVADGVSVVDRTSDKPHGDLRALVHSQLVRAGVPHDAIDDVGECTYANAAHFFSHRRDHGVTGRHLSAIVARGPA
ncbi:MAG: laccase domain-containing protein, partial [Polyangiales bacterium]